MTDKFSLYGAMDRASTECQQVGMWLMDDEYIKSDSVAYAYAFAAHNTLFDLYQYLGSAFFKETQ